MTPHEILEFWRPANLVRWSASSLTEVAIPERSKRFLCDVGLPARVDWTLEIAATPLVRLAGKPHLRKLCSDDSVPICLDERDGSVVAAEEAGERFLNADVESFAEFLVCYQRYRLAVRDLGEDEAQQLISSVESEMRRADPRAFANPESYWPVILEQMRDGLL